MNKYEELEARISKVIQNIGFISYYTSLTHARWLAPAAGRQTFSKRSREDNGP